MRKINDDFDDKIVILGLKKILAQGDMDDAFRYSIKLLEYKRFCYNEDGFRELFSLTGKEKILLGKTLFENNLNRLEKIFDERYPLASLIW